jgi:hypothetical protein
MTRNYDDIQVGILVLTSNLNFFLGGTHLLTDPQIITASYVFELDV